MDRVGQEGSSANIGALLEIRLEGRCEEGVMVSRTHWKWLNQIFC